MLSIEMAGYAALPGLLALAASVLIVPGICRSIGLITPVISRELFNVSAQSVCILFLLILIFLEPGYLAIAFLAGSISTFLFIFISAALFKSAQNPLPPDEERARAWSLGLAASGLTLAAAGLYLAIFSWENVLILDVFVLGAACVLVPVSLDAAPVRDGEFDLRPVISAADSYVSSACVLAAAMTMGAAMMESQPVWIGMPVLFALSGLAALLASALGIRVMADKRPLYYFCIACFTVLAAVIVMYVIAGQLSGKISADAIAALGMLDRMGPFWAIMTGLLTGCLLIFLKRSAPRDAERTRRKQIFVFSIYFTAAAVWISCLFADLYGIALAGMGVIGAVVVPAGRRLIRSATGNSQREPLSGPSAFSTLAIAAAGLMLVRDAAEFEKVFSGLAGMAVPAGLALGAGTAFAMKLFLNKSSGAGPEGAESRPLSRFNPVLHLGFIPIPVLIGLAAGPEALGGFLLGMTMAGVYEVFRTEREGKPEDAERLNGLVRLAALAALAAAPLAGL